MKLPLSYSRIADYERCPQYFKFRHIDRVKIEQAPEMTVGSAVHDILKSYTTQCYREGRTHLYDRWEQICYDILEAYNLGMEMEDEIMQVVKTYIEANEIELEGLAGVEDKISIDENFKPVAWDSPDVWFRFVLDKLYLLPDVAKITDYKAGYSMQADKLQLIIYAWVLFHIYPQLQQVSVEFDYVRFSYKKEWVITRAELSAIDKKVNSRVKRIYKDEAYEPRVGGYCKNCRYWEICEAYKKIGLPRRYPKTKKEAAELLGEVIKASKAVDELRKIMKEYVAESGDVRYTDIVATNVAVVKKKYNLPELVEWANGVGVDILSTLTVDSRKIKKIEVPDYLYEKTISTQFKIKGVKEKDEE